MSTITELHETETQELVRPEVNSVQLPAPPKSEFPEIPIFADVLLEASGQERKRRKWAAFSSVAFQASVLGVLLIIPLMFTEALPKQQLLTFLVAPPPPPPPPPPAAPAVAVIRHVESDLLDGRLRTPSKIPEKVQMIREEEAPPPLSSGMGGVVGGVVGGVPGGQMGGVIGGIISSAAKTAMVPKLAAPTIPKRIRVSQGVIKGMLLQKVEPKYPMIAKSARVQGTVELSAVISKTGEIQNLQVVSGHPVLVPAAIEAVKQWRYRPFLLNGEPIEVESTIIVTFQIAQ